VLLIFFWNFSNTHSIMPSNSLFSSPFNYYDTVMDHESESHNTAVPTIDVIKQIATLTSMEPERESKLINSDPTVYELEVDLSVYAHDLHDVIFAANKVRDSSDSDEIMLMCKKLEQAAFKLLEVSRKLVAAGGGVGCVSAEELINKMYPGRLQDQFNVLSVLRNRYDNLSQAKADKITLNETRQNLEDLLENAHYASHYADDIPSVEHIITKIGSTVSEMAQGVKSGKDPDKYLAKQADSLINDQAPRIIRSLRTRICYLKRRQVIVKINTKEKAAKAQTASIPYEAIPDASETSAALIPNKFVTTESSHDLNPNAAAFIPSVCKNVDISSSINPSSSDTNHFTASSYNLNNSVCNTSLQAVEHETAVHPQIESSNEAAEVSVLAPPINSTPGFSVPTASSGAYTCSDRMDVAVSICSTRGHTPAASSVAVSGSQGTRIQPVQSSPFEPQLNLLLSLHNSLKNESLAVLIRTLIDSVRRVNDLNGNIDSELINQLIQEIKSVVQKVASLCENKNLPSVFNEVSHIAKVFTSKLNYSLSYWRQVSDLDQRLFKNRKDLCNFIIEVQPACESRDPISIRKLLNNIERVSGLMQQGVDSLIKIHRENNAFKSISETKSMYQPFLIKNAPYALQLLKTELGILEGSFTKVNDISTDGSGADIEKADSIIYSKAWGETKTTVNVDVATDEPSLNSVSTPLHEVSSDNTITAAGTAPSTSEPVTLKCSVNDMPPPSDVVVSSQAKSDLCNSVDDVNLYASFNTEVKNNKPESVSPDISLNDVLNPPDAVLLKYSDAELDVNYALEPQHENNAISEAQLICCDLLHNSDETVKLARRMCVKKDILNKSHPKISRGKPRAVAAIDVNFCEVKLKNRFEPLTLLLSDASLGWAENDSESETEYSTDDDNSSVSSRTRKRKRRPRKRSEPPDPPPRAPDRPSRVQRRHNYEHARRRIRDKISKLSDIDTAIYLYLHNLNNNERDFFADVKNYLTKGSDYFNKSSATSDQWLARCVFQNESCQTTLQMFIQLHYKNAQAPTSWSRTISECGSVFANLP